MTTRTKFRRANDVNRLARHSNPDERRHDKDKHDIDLPEKRKIMAKLGEIKLKQIQQLNTANSSYLVQKHKELLNWMMRTMQLDSYALTWVQFAKGCAIGAIAMWLLMR